MWQLTVRWYTRGSLLTRRSEEGKKNIPRKGEGGQLKRASPTIGNAPIGALRTREPSSPVGTFITLHGLPIRRLGVGAQPVGIAKCGGGIMGKRLEPAKSIYEIRE